MKGERLQITRFIVASSDGFLLAILWMDLMFDIQVLGHRDGELPEAVLASIAAYYRRVTTSARPMSHLVGCVMLVMVGTLIAQWLTHPSVAHAVALVLGAAPVALGIVRVFPNAVRLGSRADGLLEQSRLARSICREHIACVVAIAALLALQATS